jgi:hypothetical protein
MTNIQEWLIMYITGNIISYIMEDTHISMRDAMEQFYTSHIFDLLQKTETGLYTESPLYVYDMFNEEKDSSGAQGRLRHSQSRV